MVILSNDQADALAAFCECFDLYTFGAWAAIEDGMREDFGIVDPEGALEAAKRVLRGEPDYE